MHPLIVDLLVSMAVSGARAAAMAISAWVAVRAVQKVRHSVEKR